MDCIKFQNFISDYLDAALDSRMRAECATHRLVCGDCRELYNDVRAAVQALNLVSQRELAEFKGPEGLDDRIIAATTAGEMLSCSDFDKLIESYFDGVILAPTFQTFQGHFEKCAKCSRLMSGIEEAIVMCREIKDSELEVPESLHDRIVAATVGAPNAGWFQRAYSSMTRILGSWGGILWSPQMAVAALIFAASSLLVLSRFGSISGMASHAETQAAMLVNQGQRAINQTGAMARTGFQRVSYEVNTLLLDDGDDDGAAKPLTVPTPIDQPQIKSQIKSINNTDHKSPQRSMSDRSVRPQAKDQRERKNSHREK